MTDISRYEYPASGAYNETVAIMTDGRVLWINTQYDTVNVTHADNCSKKIAALNPRGTRNVCEVNAAVSKATCTCGALDGIDIAALIEDARIHGLRGDAPRKISAEKIVPETHGVGWCEKCESHCYGDCEAN